jgi:hypothetical protein
MAPALLLVAAPLVTNCGSGGGLPGVPGGGSGCQADLNDPSAIMSANFGLDAEIEGKLKGALAASANLKAMAADIEAELSGACKNIAMDLGAAEGDVAPADDSPGASVKAACGAAAKLIGEVKAKASGSLTVEVGEPSCSASMEAMANCAAECDANIEPGSAEVSCEGGEISGKCSGECQGSCTVEAGAECSGECGGTCSGKCEAEFSGKCNGECEGKCDGQDKKGKCEGTCEGKCSADGEGSCGGKCEGKCDVGCKIEGQANCSGECSGGCSVEMEAPKCSGEVKPPEMSAECQANCDAKLEAELECTPPTVMVKIDGAADAEAAEKLVATLKANLPAFMAIAKGLPARVEKVTASVKASVEGIKAVVQGAGTAGMAVMGCVAGAIDAQAKAAGSLNVSVEASASVSGEASAG